MRDSVLMYRSQCDAIMELPPEQFKAAVVAIWRYAMDGVEPEDDPFASAMLGMAKPLIDKNNRKYEVGKLGGRPKNQTKPNDNQTKPTNNLTEPTNNQTEPSCNLKEKGKRLKVKEYKDDMSVSEYPYKEVIDYLNARAGTKFKDKSKDTRSHIKARIDEGFTVDDFKKVIDGRVAAWKGDAKMNEFIRPSTLFGPKFESYLNAKPIRLKPKNTFNNFEQRDYDFAELERQLTGVV